MSEQTSLVAVEIESEPTLFPQFSPTRFVGKKGVDPGNEFDLNQGVAGGGGDSPDEKEIKRRRRFYRSIDCKQSVFLCILGCTNSKTKGLERGGKRRARLGRDANIKE